MMVKQYCCYGALLLLFVPLSRLHGYSVGSFPVAFNFGSTHVSEAEVFFYSDMVPYVSGGVTIVYPMPLFTTTPSILMSVELAGRLYSTGEIVVGEITANSATSVTMHVNVYDGTSVFEAGTGDVIIHFRAVGT